MFDQITPKLQLSRTRIKRIGRHMIECRPGVIDKITQKSSLELVERRISPKQRRRFRSNLSETRRLSRKSSEPNYKAKKYGF